MLSFIPSSLDVLLAQSQSLLSNEHSWDVMKVLVWLVIASVVLGVVFWIIRKRYGRADDPSDSLGFTLADMRRLHEAGKISDEEFEQAKRQMLAQGRRMMAQGDEVDAAPPTSDPPESLGTTGNPVDNAAGFEEPADKIDWEPDRPDQG